MQCAVIGKLTCEIRPRDTFNCLRPHTASPKLDASNWFRKITRAAQTHRRSTQLVRIGCRTGSPIASKVKKLIILLDTCESGALVAGHLRPRANCAQLRERIEEQES